MRFLFAFMLQQILFSLRAGGVACERSLRAENAVARYDEGHGVMPYRAADGLRTFAAHGAGNVAVGDGFAIGYLHKL